MASFEGRVDGSLTDESLEGRFGRDIEGGALDVDLESIAAWRWLLDGLKTDADPRQVFDLFLDALQPLRPRSSANPRVFISHRQVDKDYAERIAWLASQNGLEYWLDVHDPLLNAIPASHPTYAVLVAAIIEIGLLNCTHVIAAHTPQRVKGTQWIPSQWIPYEFARAKARSLYSPQTASWFQSTVHPPESRGEYVLLGEIWHLESDVAAWLRRQALKPVKKKPFRGTGAQRPLD